MIGSNPAIKVLLLLCSLGLQTKKSLTKPFLGHFCCVSIYKGRTGTREAFYIHICMLENLQTLMFGFGKRLVYRCICIFRDGKILLSLVDDTKV